MIPVNAPLFEGNELAYLTECIKTGWVSSEGPFVAKFEKSVAGYVDRKHAVAVSSGTAALELAILSLGLGPGDEVILPAFTIISCASAIVRSGAIPVLVDCDPQTFNMEVSAIKKRITSRTRAIMMVHIYGFPCDVDPILELAREHKLKVIEDAAEMLGQTYHGRKCGSFGDVSVMSFYANKIVTCGEGGMILTDSPEIAGHSRSLRNLSHSETRRFLHEELGWNYRMTNLQAALGLAQMEQLEKFICRKRHIGEMYQKLLKGTSGIRLPVPHANSAENIYWVFPLIVDLPGKDAAWLASKLQQQGIATRPFFVPMHEQPVLQKMGLFAGEKYPVSESISREGLYLPSGLALTDEEISSVCQALKSALK